MKIFRNQTLKIWSFVLFLIVIVFVVAAYIRPVFVPRDVSTYTTPETTLLETRNALEKESIQAQFNQNIAELCQNAKTDILGSKTFSVLVQGVSKGIDFGKRIWRGDYINGYQYHPESAPADVQEVQITLPPGFELAEVIDVVDGDTLKVNVLASNANNSSCYGLLDSVEKYVRLIGVNTSESSAGVKAGYVAEDYDTEIGEMASAYTKELLEGGQLIFLQTDTNDTDQYDRLLRYVWLDQPQTSDPDNNEAVSRKTINGLLLVDGIAEAVTYGEDNRYADLFTALMNEAKTDGTGLWALTETMSAKE